MGFEVVPHTADLAVKVWGKNLPELFQSALDGYRFLLVGDKTIKASTVQCFSIDAQDRESLLVRFCNKLVFLFDTEAFLPVSVKLKIEGCHLEAEVAGSNSREDIRHCVKAATYHNLSIENLGNSLSATIVFDD